jgi:hypothetical protein
MLPSALAAYQGFITTLFLAVLAAPLVILRITSLIPVSPASVLAKHVLVFPTVSHAIRDSGMGVYVPIPVPVASSGIL